MDNKTQVRSIFISDLHLGSSFAKSEEATNFLKQYNTEYLYLVGDIIDGWKFKNFGMLNWDENCNAFIKKVLKMSNKGVKVFYTAGNHDEFLRGFFSDIVGLRFLQDTNKQFDFGSIHLGDRFIHTTADNKKIIVIHGDQFERLAKFGQVLSRVGDIGYEFLLRLNQVYNFFRAKFGLNYWSVSSYIKNQVKKAVQYVADFEITVARYAQEHHCDGILCGHIHCPAIKQISGITYYNCGDLVESCTAIIEELDGTLKLVKIC